MGAKLQLTDCWPNSIWLEWHSDIPRGGAINGVFDRLAQRWGKVFKADTYFSLGIEGCLEILDDSVWAMYTPESRWIYGRLHPQRAPLPELELLWPSA